jgi:mono/diheme cytochrome c family protein
VRRLRSRIGIAAALGVGALVLLAGAQAIPYGRAHDNPTPTQSVRFPDARSQRLFATACGDCHSDRTRWPWYSNVAPMSWLVQKDVDEGRGILNVSEWDKPQPDIGEVVDKINGGGMPPWQYKLIHGDSDLSKPDRAYLAAALQRMYRQDPPPTRGRG